jgi:AcrR family transcriptional regulator
VTETETVLDAAARRLASHGIASTTVDTVAAAADVSRATVYRYVGGKDEIVRAVIRREAENVLAQVTAVITASTSPTEAIAGAVSAALTAIDQNPVLARLTSSDLRETLPFITADSRVLVAVEHHASSAATDGQRQNSRTRHRGSDSFRIRPPHDPTPRRISAQRARRGCSCRVVDRPHDLTGCRTRPSARLTAPGESVALAAIVPSGSLWSAWVYQPIHMLSTPCMSLNIYAPQSTRDPVRDQRCPRQADPPRTRSD